MSQSIYIMYKDTKVLQVHIDTGFMQVLNAELLPFKFKGSILPVLDYSEIKSHYDDVQRQIAIKKNNALFINWLAERTLILSQRYAKKLYQAYRLVQRDDEVSRAKLALTYKALSLQDNYWVTNDIGIKWKDIDLQHNSLHNSIAQISLHGKSLTLDGTPDPATFSTNGAYAKAWHRDPDGTLWLYKAGDRNSEERIEVMCSNILNRCNVSHCHYEERFDKDLRVCACPSMTSDIISIMDGDTFSSYCNHHNLDLENELLKLDPEGYHKMLIVDYLISNRDRHTQNWGLYYKADSMEILGLHPLFDHNNAFDQDTMNDVNYVSHFRDSTLQKNALYAIKQVDFHFTAPITRDIFITERQYKSFISKAEELGIQTKSITRDDLYVQYGGFQKYKQKVEEIIPNSIKQLGTNDDYIQSLLKALHAIQGTHNCYR